MGAARTIYLFSVTPDRIADVRQAMAESGAPVAAMFDRAIFIGLVSLDDIVEAETVLACVQRGTPPAFGTRPHSGLSPADA